MIIEPLAAQIADSTSASTAGGAVTVLAVNGGSTARLITLGGGATFTLAAGHTVIVKKGQDETIVSAHADVKLTKVQTLGNY
jgi:hypothetical protein